MALPTGEAADSAGGRSTGLHGFPAEMTSFVGRRAEVRSVRKHLEESRLVTLTGVGGVGKTRLACTVATELRRAYPDGIWFIDLSELMEEELVPAAVADALGVRSSPTNSVLFESLAHRQALVVLDNCEHLLEACSALAHKLLRSAPKMRIMTTSREPLSVLGETIFDVTPLSLASRERYGTAPARDGSRSEAVDLFEARATAVQPEFRMEGANRRAVAELCDLLDGIPLAIELAAFQVRSFPVTQILTRHESIFDILTRGNRAGPHRHQTLQATLEWSYDLCLPGERMLWQRLSVFTGSFDLDAVQGVCGDAQDRLDVLEHFPRLIEKSIVAVLGSGPSTRYRLLESIRHFGGSKLAEHDDVDTWRRRHRDHYLRVTLLSERHVNGPEQVEWNGRLQDDFPNIRSALDYCFTTAEEYATGLRMAGSLWFFWNASGHLRDGRHWLDRALELASEATPERAKALWAVGWYAMVQGDSGVALGALEESAAVARSTGDDHAFATALQFQGTAAQTRGDLTSARDLLVAAMQRHEEGSHDDVLAILCAAQLGFVYCVLGMQADALRHVDAAIAVGRRTGERFATSWALWSRGLIAWSTGSFDDAGVVLRESIELKWTLHDWLGMAACIELLTWLAVEDGDYRGAARLLGIGRGLCGDLGSSPLFGDVTLSETRERYELRARRSLGTRRFDDERADAEALDRGQAIAHVLATRAREERRAAPAVPEAVLTRRETEVVRLIVDGMTNKEIADTLVISRRTVEGHVERALVKLGLRSRSQLAAWFVQEHAAPSADNS
ncbi:LuxR family transcriptional regulator [Pseudonocardia petroleophila]|uniref:LuxR family transcriptional regulator n=1 Tax=Pseudonocardia petroleophila TaxID=37331 RepID=A0A7G7MCI6_9PSEU|nr:LuxR C-terminal-related transcriptional regulator [Pseudonocardia petroleophila]QNG50497.1 LuxR family transcriptional regulator [Pseudonocardia petroleophila]